MITDRLNVLVVAHELSPIKGSECAEGWNIVTRLAKYHNVTVIYASGSQFGKNSYVDAVNDFIQTNGSVKGLTFVNIDRPRVTRILASINKRFKALGSIGLPVLYYVGYKFWHKAAYDEAKRLHELNKFHVAHQLTQITFREPGYVWKLGIPFFWGPTGGTSVLPIKFYSLLSKTSILLEIVRTLSNVYQFNFNRRVINANKKASVIYAFSEHDVNKFSKRAKGKIKVMLDAGTYENVIQLNDHREIVSKPKLLWCGQLSDRKAPSILLKALALDSRTKDLIDVIIIGSGPLKEAMQKLALNLGLNNIAWIERVSHDEIFKLMEQADFLVHTSIREATTNVIPEALSTGLPIICHDVNGMSLAVNETCGIKVPFVSPETSILGFHNAILKLITDKNYLIELKKGARTRSVEISWDNMVQSISNDYIESVRKIDNQS